MEYGRIVQRSFEIAWRYKALWVFGLFAAGGSSLNFDFGQEPFPAMSPEAMPMINPDMFTPELVMSVFALALIMVVLFILAYAISNPALVDATNRLERGGKYSFGAALSAGIDYFARSLGLWLVLFLCTGAILAGGIFILIILLTMADAGGGGGAGAAVLGVLGFLAMIPIMLVLYFATYTIGSLGQRALVVRDCGIGDALAEGWYLLKNNIMSSVVVFLIFIGISMGLTFVAAIVFMAFNAIIHVFITPAGVGFQAYFVVALIVGLPISLILGGYFGTFFSNLYTLFYFELVDPRPPSAKPAFASPAPTGPPAGPSPNAPIGPDKPIRPDPPHRPPPFEGPRGPQGPEEPPAPPRNDL